MAPTYQHGQLLATYPVERELKRGDVVVFERDGVAMLKRVMFVAGDRFPMYRMNGEWFAAPSEESLRASQTALHCETKTIRVPAGSVFLVGDNWTMSVDSRKFGPVPVDSVTRILRNESQPPLEMFAGATLRRDRFHAMR